MTSVSLPISTSRAHREAIEGVKPARQQCLYFLPLPHGQGSFLPIFSRASRDMTLRHYRDPACECKNTFWRHHALGGEAKTRLFSPSTSRGRTDSTLPAVSTFWMRGTGSLYRGRRRFQGDHRR